MGDCDNFKSPSDLGLKICTSDVSCYTGSILECIDLPSNPDLNDIIKAADEAICELTDLINSGGGVPVIPNDLWKELVLGDMTFSNYTGTAGGVLGDYGATLFFTYKVISEDTALVRCRMSLFNVPITGILDFVQFNFTVPDLLAAGSNWFAVDKQFTTASFDNTTLTHSPVSIVATDGTTNQYISKGRATMTNNLCFVGFCQPNIPNGTYNFEIDFELTCRLLDA